MDFRMSIGVEPIRMRTDRGIVITGYNAAARARTYFGSAPVGKRSRTPDGSASSRRASPVAAALVNELAGWRWAFVVFGSVGGGWAVGF